MERRPKNGHSQWARVRPQISARICRTVTLSSRYLPLSALPRKPSPRLIHREHFLKVRAQHLENLSRPTARVQKASASSNSHRSRDTPPQRTDRAACTPRSMPQSLEEVLWRAAALKAHLRLLIDPIRSSRCPAADSLPSRVARTAPSIRARPKPALAGPLEAARRGRITAHTVIAEKGLGTGSSLSLQRIQLPHCCPNGC